MFICLSEEKQHAPSMKNKEPLEDTCVTEVKMRFWGQIQVSFSEILVMTDEAYFSEVKFWNLSHLFQVENT